MAEKSKFWYLKYINLFEGMDEHAMKMVDELTTMSSARPQQPIYFPDEPSRAIFFLKEGHVKISRINADGKEVILDIIGPGEVFGELALLDEGEGRNQGARLSGILAYSA